MILLIWLHNKTASPPLNYSFSCSSYCPRWSSAWWGRNNKAHIRPWFMDICNLSKMINIVMQFIGDQWIATLSFIFMFQCSSTSTSRKAPGLILDLWPKLEQHSHLLSQSSPHSDLISSCMRLKPLYNPNQLLANTFTPSAILFAAQTRPQHVDLLPFINLQLAVGRHKLLMFAISLTNTKIFVLRFSTFITLRQPISLGILLLEL